VRLVEAVLGELGHQVEKMLGQCFRVAFFLGAFTENATVLGHFLGLFLAHGAAQHVGATQRVTADDLRDLHHLFLVHDHAVGRLQASFQIVVEIVDLLLALLAQDEVVHHPRAKRAGTVEREHGDDVLEAVRREFLEQLLHAFRFHLEDRRGVGILQNLVGTRVVEGQRIEVRPVTGQFFDIIDGELDDGQVAQTEEVELHQPDLFHVVLVVLRNDRRAGIGGIQRAEVGQLAGGDQHATSVHADIARQVFKTAGQFEQLLDLFFLIDALLQLRLGLDGLGQGQRLVLLDRDQLGELIAEVVGHVEHAPDVTNHRLRRHGAEGGDLRYGIVTVFVAHVFDDAPAIVLAEVDVEVGHRHPFRVEKALEEQRVAERIEIGDAQ
jgi:hypothetical protein